MSANCSAAAPNKSWRVPREARSQELAAAREVVIVRTGLSCAPCPYSSRPGGPASPACLKPMTPSLIEVPIGARTREVFVWDDYVEDT